MTSHLRKSHIALSPARISSRALCLSAACLSSLHLRQSQSFPIPLRIISLLTISGKRISTYDMQISSSLLMFRVAFTIVSVLPPMHSNAALGIQLWFNMENKGSRVLYALLSSVFLPTLFLSMRIISV